MVRRIAVILLACGVAGCAGLPRITTDTHESFEALNDPQLAGLYVFCDGPIGTRPKANVLLDGHPLGQVGAFTYVRVEVPPGHHSVVSALENTSTLEFEAEAGHNYNVWQEMTFGWILPRVELHLLSLKESRDALQLSQPVTPTYQAQNLDDVRTQTLLAIFFGHVLGAFVGPVHSVPFNPWAP